MFVMKKHISRRAMLRGMGVTLALPLLDAIVPAMTAQAQTPGNPLQRLGFIYVPHGAVMDKWTPVGTGTNFEFSPILSPLEPFRNRVTVVSGLAHKQADSLGDGGADHARSGPVYLSAV